MCVCVDWILMLLRIAKKTTMDISQVVTTRRGYKNGDRNKRISSVHVGMG